VAIALRNRWRRHLLAEDLKASARRARRWTRGPFLELSCSSSTGGSHPEEYFDDRSYWLRQNRDRSTHLEAFASAVPQGCPHPSLRFVHAERARLTHRRLPQVEATKFTEVGFHGRDVDQIIRDLVEVALNLTRKRRADQLRPEAQRAVEDHILDTLTGSHAAPSSQSSFREMLRKGVLDDRQIDVEIPVDRGMDRSGVIQLDQSNPVSLHEFLGKFQKMAGSKRATERKKMSIRDARPVIEELELEKLMDAADIQKEAIQSVEESGIVFIDEIDKICNTGDYRGADASAEGVQRDLLPLIEGSTISTKYGNINTDYILFIASGAFHQCKPSDLLAELQVRGARAAGARRVTCFR
jgi:ATP-dependent HslUV protease ATP-binding subunit HslU